MESEFKKFRIIKFYHTNNITKIEMPFIDNKKCGIERSYFEDGTLKYEFSYFNNLLNGTSKRYNLRNKLVSKFNYKNNLLHGIDIIYDHNENHTFYVIIIMVKLMVFGYKNFMDFK